MKITGWRITNNCFAKITVVGGLNGTTTSELSFLSCQLESTRVTLLS